MPEISGFIATEGMHLSTYSPSSKNKAGGINQSRYFPVLLASDRGTSNAESIESEKIQLSHT